MHTHSDYSPDCRTSIADQARAVRSVGLDVVCATDHGTIEGALRLREIADGFRVIVGEEIATRDGELVGLFLEHAVPSGLTAEETIARIRDQGGLVSVPHPFSHTRPQRIRRDALDRLWPLVDCIEVFNGRETSAQENRQARAYARERNVPGAVGSDAHRESEFGGAWVEIEEFVGAAEFIAALQGGVIRGRVPWLHGLASARFEGLRRWLGRRR